MSTVNPALEALGHIAEADISVSAVRAIFETVGYECTVDEDGDLLVESGTASANVLVDTACKLMCFVAGLSLKELAASDLKMSIANNLNEEFVMARFYVVSPTTLLADYTIPYERGLSAVRLVEMFDRFTEIASAAFTGNDNLLLIAEE